jgi:quercetin dioxygenase-like cupin family protein
VQRETLEPEGKWSEHVKPQAKAESCRKFHVRFIISGRQMIRLNDGTEALLAGDFAIIPPGHDAWAVGEEKNVLLELAGFVKQG